MSETSADVRQMTISLRKQIGRDHYKPAGRNVEEAFQAETSQFVASQWKIATRHTACTYTRAPWLHLFFIRMFEVSLSGGSNFQVRGVRRMYQPHSTCTLPEAQKMRSR